MTSLHDATDEPRDCVTSAAITLDEDTTSTNRGASQIVDQRSHLWRARARARRAAREKLELDPELVDTQTTSPTGARRRSPDEHPA